MDGGRVVAMGGVLARLGGMLNGVPVRAVDALPDDPVDGQIVFSTSEAAAFVWDKTGWAVIA